MTTTTQVELLLITISVTVLAIIAVAFVIELLVLLNKLKLIAGKADNIFSNIEEISTNIKNATEKHSKHGFMKMVSLILNRTKEK